MKKTATIFLLLFCALSFAQINGTVTNTKGDPLSFVSVYLENSVTGTTTNDNGYYELSFRKKGQHTFVFQYLGYKTIKKTVTISSFPFTVNAVLTEEEMMLDEIAIKTETNPADAIIRNAIANKKKNTDKFSTYAAKFYSRGLFKIKNAPKTFLGQNLGDFGGGLDSTRSGIVYLSETISEIKHQKPDNFKEKIIASKVSGMDNGISFNRAADVNFNFYNNTFPIADSELISPISNYAFGYYNYKLIGTFYTKEGKLINKIQVIPKRKNDRVFKGAVYVIEDVWALYGVDVTVTGTQINNPAIDTLHLKQNYNYSSKNDAWVMISQTIDFKVGMFGFNVNGRFSAAYSDYNFNPNFNENTFGREILSFEKEATKKDTSFWNTLRPVPLTLEETKDYIKKDSIKVIRKSKSYLDSIDRKRNKPTFLSPITGYTYRNSYKKWSLGFDSPIENLNFNTVQGWNTSLAINYFKRLNDKGKWIAFGTDFNYGFSEKVFRPSAYLTYKWNNFERPILRFSGGITTSQFNERNPISKFRNTIFSIFSEQNFLKIYEKSFAKVSFSSSVFDGVRMSTSLEFADRKPLFNTTNYVMFPNKDIDYTSNNPQDPTNFTSSFTPHQMFTFSLGARIAFGSKYLSYPDSKFTIRNPKYPSLFVGYKKRFGANNGQLGSDLIYAQLHQRFSLSNLGEFKYRAHSGAFLKQKDIPFMDYAHFNGNNLPTVSAEDYTTQFNLLNYYTFSTNDKYAELHGEHNFKGFITNKIPLLNKLNFHLVAGAKALFTDKKPYSEFSIGLDNIGWGKWRFLRIDYVQSYYNGQKQTGWVFGLNLFN